MRNSLPTASPKQEAWLWLPNTRNGILSVFAFRTFNSKPRVCKVIGLYLTMRESENMFRMLEFYSVFILCIKDVSTSYFSAFFSPFLEI